MRFSFLIFLDIREEAVKEALVQARQERHDALAPSKRRDPNRLSCIHQTPERDAT
ncbi:unnamed protein product [Schistosoma mattheei]|uniref:Uncharacterized protein n=1 Tax=Schistosoma mattheei TaxID=31246 RepID=A0A183NLL3_9TREM|nr:unnamed protein product [Schistosoma mattheei]